MNKEPRRWCPVALKKRKKGRFGVGAELRGQILDRPPILGGSVGPSKAPLAYRPTSSRPLQQGHRSVSDRVPTLRGVEPVGVSSRRCVAATEEEQRSPGTHTEVRPGVVVVVQCSVSSLTRCRRRRRRWSGSAEAVVALAGMMVVMVAAMAAAMEAIDVEMLGRVGRRWARDEAAVVLAEVMVAAVVEAMKARRSGGQRR